LKTHKKKACKSEFLKNMSLCEKTFKSKQKYRNHKFEHTNWERTNNSYSCKDCEFEGYNMHTRSAWVKLIQDFMNVEYVIYNWEIWGSLELHLITCEIYKCRDCSHKERNVSEIKKHALTAETTKRKLSKPCIEIRNCKADLNKI
jgi:hypothetical protein